MGLSVCLLSLHQDEYYRYGGAYSPGFQEFIESASFLHYLEHGQPRALRVEWVRESIAMDVWGSHRCLFVRRCPSAPTATAGTLLTHRELESEIEQTVGKHITIPLSDYIVGILDLGSDIKMRATKSAGSSIHFRALRMGQS